MYWYSFKKNMNIFKSWQKPGIEKIWYNFTENLQKTYETFHVYTKNLKLFLN